MSSAAGSVCYRHTDRPAFVSCQRCDRTVCPDCQIPAAVGVICPECFAAERRAAPAAVRRAQRTAGSIATYTLIGVTLAVYALQLIPGLGLTEAWLYAGVYSAPGAFEPWRMVTSMFVHSTSMIFHVLLNMYTLWVFGKLLEPFIGSWRLVVLYLLSGLGGSVAVLWLSDPMVPVVGASGAIFGIIGAFIVIHRSLGGSAPQLYILLGLNLIIGFLPGLAIAWEAHLGGLAVGAAIGWLFSVTRRTDQRPVQTVGLAGIAVALIVLSLRFVLFGV